MPTLTAAHPSKFETSRHKFEAVAPKGWREVPVPLGKVHHHGIEVQQGLHWQKWEPGSEYIKHIVLKNIKVKTEKIKYHVPSTRFFSTLYPKMIVLSAGTSFTLPVTFRPLERIQYNDRIVFETKEGSFDVCLGAVLPQVDITIPQRLEFPMCAAQNSVKLLFEVKNTGDLPTTFQWETTDPFLLQPVEATLQPQSSCTVKASFQPTGACVYEATVMCYYGPDFSLHKSIQLYGIGKYPHISVSSPGDFGTDHSMPTTVEFGTIPIGQSAEKWVELHNLSPVSAPYRVDHPVGVKEIDAVFNCPQLHGTAPAMSTVRIPLTFTPNTVGTTSTDYFHVIAIGNVSKSVIKCVGSSKGPCVELSSTTLNFMQIKVGDVATRTVDIINHSDTEAVIQLMVDCEESVFKLEETCFTLEAESQRTLLINFVPQYPINYYRRVTCLVHNQGSLYLDLLGTCHSELVKPAVLLATHIDRYNRHIERGYSLFSPEQLNEFLEKKTLRIDESGALASIEEGENETSPPGQEVATTNDGFHSNTQNEVPHVSLDTDTVDFGCCQNIRLIEDQTISVTNHTKGKITVQWVTERSRTFSVCPAVIDIPPEKTVGFQVSFKPTAPNQFYGCELESYVYYKSLRDYRLTEDVTHSPPWCLTLNCLGQTFMPHNETFLPRYVMDSPRVVFPAVNCDEVEYRSVLLTNTGTTPIMFDVEKDSNDYFSVRPCKGVIHSGHQIFVMKTRPTHVQHYQKKLRVQLNASDKHYQDIELESSAESPSILLETEGEMYMKPTCLATTSNRQYTIKNISRIPLRYEWKISAQNRDLLSVSPSSGLIQPNESLSHCWEFSPKDLQKYLLKPVLLAWGQGHRANSSEGKKKQFSIRVLGEGTLGEIKCEQSYVNLGDILIGNSSSTQLVLFNNSDCSLHYSLHVDETLEEETTNTAPQNTVLKLSIMKGVLAARSRQYVTAFVSPNKRRSYQFAISYNLLTSNDESCLPSEPQYLCHLLFTGVFPSLKITDARCQGSASGISKKQLWNLFSLDSLNVCLDADPAPPELQFSMKTRASLERRIATYTRALLDINFSAAPVGSEPCEVTLLVENTGTVNATWSFLFPSDLQMDLEHWAETGQLDEEELHQMKVMQNELFTVEPKTGQLPPGESQAITFTYKHIMAGTDRLPVLLKLVNGREILLNFVGVTVDAGRRYVHFPASKHQFAPVPVGEKVSPKQIYEIYNGGALPVFYEFDLTPLAILSKENYEQAVLECVNPRGELSPGKSAQIEWRFSPIEAKTYVVDLPIHVDGGDTAVITFTGVGYDKRQLGESMKMTDDPAIEGVPSKQCVPVPGQLAYLSEERLSLGNLPLFSQARRMVSVTNRSRDHTVSFHWHVTSQRDAQFLSIYPMRGNLKAGESQLCRVCFTAHGDPSFYDLDLVCEITDETVMKEYKKASSEWEAEQTRQKYEFTISEKDLQNADNSDGTPNRPRSGQLTALEEEHRLKATAEQLAKYKTLPPIKTLTYDELRRRERARRKMASTLWEKPVSLIPFVLHLGVTARTHDVREFQDNFPETYRGFFIDRALSERSSKLATDKSVCEEKPVSSSGLVCYEREGELVAGVLSNILRGLMDDTYFHDAVEKISQEPVPYFLQYANPVRSGVTEGCVQPVNPEVMEALETLVKEIGEAESEGRSNTPGSHKSLPERTVGGLTPKLASPVHTPPASASSHSTGQRSPPHCPGSPPCSPDTNNADKTEEERRKALNEEKDLQEKQDLKKLSEFGNVCESVIENSLMNIMCEALCGEFRITAKPRFIALPQRQGSASRGNKP